MASNDNQTLTEAVILAGGFGTRLKSIVSDRPKALAELSGRPFIEFQLEWLIQQGITNVTIAVHHMAEQLQAFVEQWDNKKINLSTVYEHEPLGTGGALVNVIREKEIRGNVLVINGDTLFKFDIEPAQNLFENNLSKVVLVGSEVQDASRFGTMKIQNSFVCSFHQATGIVESGIVSSGAYIMHSSLLMDKELKPFSLEYDFFPELAIERKLMTYVVDSSKGFFDIGTPDSYKKIYAQ
jgi:D-glycero-alpha-D-manno-heptose 1-phosphate guanylyltransferase